MEDFRTTLYKKYQSSFKKYIDKMDPTDSDSDVKYFRHKYLPLIEEFNLDAAILDLGCGTGIMMNYLSRAGYKNMEGVDISEEQIDVAKNRGLNVSVDDAFHFLDNCINYDIIFILDFIEHFTKAEILILMDKIFNRLKKGGAVIIRTPNGNGFNANKIIYGDLTHITIFNSNSLTQLLKFYNFETVEFFESGPIPKSVKGTVGFILWNVEKLFLNILRYVETGTTEKCLTKEFVCKAVKRK